MDNGVKKESVLRVGEVVDDMAYCWVPDSKRSMTC